MNRTHRVRSLLGSLLLLALPLPAIADQEARPASGANAPGMKAIVYGFFDDRTGARIGRLQIENVALEYQHRGFLRVAWDPLVVLDGVTLEIDAAAIWPDAGVKIVDALRVTGRQNASVLRHVRLRLGGARQSEITAESALLRKDGALELTGVELAAGSTAATLPASGRMCFWLAGPRAGQLTTVPPASADIAALFSAGKTLAQPAP